MNRKCPRCNVPLKEGLAISGQEDWYIVRACWIVINHDKVRFSCCLKCPKCGHSETK